MSKDRPAVSVHPDDFAEGGLAVIGAKVVLQNPKYVLITGTDPDTGDSFERPCFAIDMVDYETGENYGYEGGPQTYGVGKASDWMVTKDGDLLPAIEGKKINKNTKFAIFMRELVNAGFNDELLIEDGIAAIHNTVCIMGDVPYMIGGEVRKRKAKDGNEYDDQVIVPTDVVMTAEEYEKESKKAGKKTSGGKGKASGKGKAAGKASGKGKAQKEVEAPEGDILEVAVETITDLLADADEDGIAISALPAKVMRKLLKDPNRQPVMAAVQNSFDDVVALAAASDAPWVISDDEESVVLAE